jgi:hypothetical protein
MLRGAVRGLTSVRRTGAERSKLYRLYTNRLREKVENSNSVLCKRDSGQNIRVWILSGSVGCFLTNVVVSTVHWETFLQITLAEKRKNNTI